MTDVTQELNKAAYNLRWNERKVDYKDGEFKKHDELKLDNWLGEIRRICEAYDEPAINICACNLTRDWDSYNDQEPWRRREVIREVVRSFHAFRDETEHKRTMGVAGLTIFPDENGFFPLQVEILKYLDREIVEHMVVNGYFDESELETVAMEMGRNFQVEALSNLIETGTGKDTDRTEKEQG